MIETFSPRLLPSEERYRQLLLQRKRLGLTPFDLMLLGYLIRLSQRRTFIDYSVAFLAETLHEEYSRIAASIHKFKQLDIVRKIAFKKKEAGRIVERTGLVVSPFIVNTGSSKRRAFKIKIWAES